MLLEKGGALLDASLALADRFFISAAIGFLATGCGGVDAGAGGANGGDDCGGGDVEKVMTTIPNPFYDTVSGTVAGLCDTLATKTTVRHTLRQILSHRPDRHPLPKEGR